MYNLKFSKVLKKSTFHNLKWWGDKISGKNLNGINNKFRAGYDLNYFSSKDIYTINNFIKMSLKNITIKNYQDKYYIIVFHL